MKLAINWNDDGQQADPGCFGTVALLVALAVALVAAVSQGGDR